MRIYIDGLFYRGSGIGRYYESLTKELALRGCRILTAVPLKYKDHFYSDFKDIPYITPIFVKYEKFSLKSFFVHSLLLRKLKYTVDIYFFPHVNIPFFAPRKVIVTIHDLRPFTNFWDRNIIKKFIFKYLVLRIVSKALYIICTSQTTKKELINYKSDVGYKIKTIYISIDDKFLNPSKSIKLMDSPYILFIGNRKKHKNIYNLILAYDQVKNDIPHKLVIAGSKDKEVDEIDKLIVKLCLQDKIVQFISPDDNTIINLYSYADLFVFPSLFEGFGLPPLEAIACGCPTITSNIPVLIEILGDEIACFNPFDTYDIAQKILLSIRDDNYKKRLITIGKEKLLLYNKEKIINEYMSLFNFF